MTNDGTLDSRESKLSTTQTTKLEKQEEAIVLAVIQEWNEAMMLGKSEVDAVSNIGKNAKDRITSLIQSEANRIALEAIRKDDVQKWDEDDTFCVTCGFEPTDGTRDCICIFRNKLRAELEEALTAPEEKQHDN